MADKPSIDPKRVDSVLINGQSVPFEVVDNQIRVEVPWMLAHKDISIVVNYDLHDLGPDHLAPKKLD